jgi:molybdate transport system substrate-binding protein
MRGFANLVAGIGTLRKNNIKRHSTKHSFNDYFVEAYAFLGVFIGLTRGILKFVRFMHKIRMTRNNHIDKFKKARWRAWRNNMRRLIELAGGFAVAALPVAAPAYAETPLPVPSAPAIAPSVTVFAAASLQNALDAAAAAYKAKTGVEVKISYAGSMTLAKQIEASAPADVFVSADVASMDYLAQKNLIQPKTRSDLLGNKLVMIAPRTSKLGRVALTKEGFAAALGEGRIATGDVASVPVGKYAKAALEKLGLWALAEPHFAFTENVRAAMVFVAREEAPLGVVYLTDAKSEPKVKVVATFPAESHPPIVYPIALTTSAKGDGPTKLLAFLKSAAAKAIFVEKGFAVLP